MEKYLVSMKIEISTFLMPFFACFLLFVNLAVRAVREIRMQSIVVSSSVCCLAVHSTLTGTVIGCEDGSVFLYSGDITRDKVDF